MKVEVKWDTAAIRKIQEAAKAAAAEALEVTYTDLVNSHTMPFDTGDMQNNQTFVDQTEQGAVLITGSPQARRLYYHPEYNFQRGKNKNAGAKWLEPYISGEKKDFVKTEFAKALGKRLGSK